MRFEIGTTLKVETARVREHREWGRTVHIYHFAGLFLLIARNPRKVRAPRAGWLIKF